MGKTVMLDNKMHKDLKQLALDNDTTMIRLINDFIYKKGNDFTRSTHIQEKKSTLQPIGEDEELVLTKKDLNWTRSEIVRLNKFNEEILKEKEKLIKENKEKDMELENKEYEIDDIRKSCEKYKEQANAKQSTNEKLSPNNMMTNVNCIKCDERKQQFDEMVDKKEDEIEKQKRKVDDRDNIIDNLRLMLKDKLNAGDIFDFDYALALTKLGHQVGHISRPISDSLVIIDNELRIQGKTNKKFMPKDDELFFCRRKLILENTTLPTTNQPNVTEETETTQN